MKAELRKYLSPAAFIILSLCLIGRFLSAFLYNPPFSFSEHIYNETAKHMEGELSPEKAEWVDQEMNKAKQIITDYSTQNINSTHITRQEYENAKQRIEVLKIYQQKCAAYSEASEFAPVFFEDLPLWRFSFQYESDYFAFVAFMTIGLMSWGLEFRKGLRTMLLTSINGKKQLYRRKFIVSCLLGFVLSMLFTCVYLISFAIKEDLTGFNFPIQSLLPYAECTLHCSVRSYLLLSTLFKASILSVLGSILAVICSTLQEISSSAVIISAFILIPVIINKMLPDFFCALSTGIQLFSSIRSSHMLIMAVTFQTAILAGCYYIGNVSWSSRSK